MKDGHVVAGGNNLTHLGIDRSKSQRRVKRGTKTNGVRREVQGLDRSVIDVGGRIDIINDRRPNPEKKILTQELTDESSCESGLFSRISCEQRLDMEHASMSWEQVLHHCRPWIAA